MLRRLHIGYWLSLLTAAALATVYAYERDLYGLYLRNQARQQESETQRRQLERLQLKEQELQRTVDGLGHDAVEIEASIRRGRNLVRPGEKVYRVELDPPSVEEVGDAPAQPAPLAGETWKTGSTTQP